MNSASAMPSGMSVANSTHVNVIFQPAFLYANEERPARLAASQNLTKIFLN